MDGQTFKEIIVFIFGIASLIFRKSYAQKSVEFQNKNFGFQYNQFDVQKTVYVVVLFSIAMIVGSVLSFFEIGGVKI